MCDYVITIRGFSPSAVDTEFTGLHATPQDEVRWVYTCWSEYEVSSLPPSLPPSLSLLCSLFDTMTERYAKLKKFSEKFVVCQFGILARYTAAYILILNTSVYTCTLSQVSLPSPRAGRTTASKRVSCVQASPLTLMLTFFDFSIVTVYTYIR